MTRPDDMQAVDRAAEVLLRLHRARQERDGEGLFRFFDDWRIAAQALADAGLLVSDEIRAAGGRVP